MQPDTNYQMLTAGHGSEVSSPAPDVGTEKYVEAHALKRRR